VPRVLRSGALLALVLASGCNSAIPHALAGAFDRPPDPAPWIYEPRTAPDTAVEREAELLERFAPAFVIEEGEAEFNRIGTPSLYRRAGVEWARVDTARASLYAEARPERIGERELVQLVYRIHFDQFAWTASHLTSLHRNAGLLVLVTVDPERDAPLFLTSVHTCGCWLAISPTTALDDACLPPDWPPDRLDVWGERIPARLAEPGPGERYVLHLASRTHRVRDVTLEPAAPPSAPRGAIELVLRPHDELYALAIQGAPGEHGSFFYERGFLRGHVRGAWAPIEGLTLGLLVLDVRLGMDKDFGDPSATGARFYTAIAPWKRERSRLDRFGRMLEGLGFQMAASAPVEGG